LAVSVEFEVEGAIGASSVGNDLRFDATFLLSFKVTAGEKLSEPEVAQVAESLGVFCAWPYFRELLQSTASRCGIHGLLAPVLILEIASSPAVTAPQHASPTSK
jgi:hypothetical protein